MKMQYPLPTSRQEEWADMEIGVIIHHCMDVYHPEIPGDQMKCSPDRMPAESFAPTDVDTDQWLEAASKLGAKYAVLVANHVTGFSIWPTKENKYSIESSPYQNGKADIVRDFMESCLKYDIRPGLYYSTGCNGFCGITDEVEPDDYTSVWYQEYVRMVERQLAEIWGNYGELFEIWFDGGVIPHGRGGPDVMGLIRKYQPDAICFQGPEEHFQNLRWVGNERGRAPLNCWSTSDRNTCSFGGEEEHDRIGIGNPDGRYWIPAETDMGNRKPEAAGGGWIWEAGESHLAYSPEELFDRYLTSVGRNSNLLVGMCIDREGHFEDVEQFEGFGRLIQDFYKTPVISCRGIGMEFELNLEEEERIRSLVIMEDIHYGERVRSFVVEVLRDAGWEAFFEAGCIGHKRIVPVDSPVRGVRLCIHRAIDTPVIKSMTLYR